MLAKNTKKVTQGKAKPSSSATGTEGSRRGAKSAAAKTAPSKPTKRAASATRKPVKKEAFDGMSATGSVLFSGAVGAGSGLMDRYGSGGNQGDSGRHRDVLRSKQTNRKRPTSAQPRSRAQSGGEVRSEEGRGLPAGQGQPSNSILRMANSEDRDVALQLLRGKGGVQVVKTVLDGRLVSHLTEETLPFYGTLAISTRTASGCYSDILCFASLVHRAMTQVKEERETDAAQSQAGVLLEEGAPALHQTLIKVCSMVEAVAAFARNGETGADMSETFLKARANVESLFHSGVPACYIHGSSDGEKVLARAKKEVITTLGSLEKKSTSLSSAIYEPRPSRRDRPTSAPAYRGQGVRSLTDRVLEDYNANPYNRVSSEMDMRTPQQKLDDIDRSVQEMKTKGNKADVVALRVQYVALTHLSFGEQSYEYVRALAILAWSYLDCGRADAALLHASKAHKANMELSEMRCKNYHPFLLNLLARCHMARKNTVEAEVCVQKGLKFNEALRGSDDPCSAELYHTKAILMDKNGRTKDAEEALLKALAVRETVKHEEPSAYGEVLCAVGEHFRKRGDEEDAFDYFVTAYEFLSKELGLNSLLCGKACRSLGRIHMGTRDMREAAIWFGRASSAFDKGYGEMHKSSLAVRKELGIALVEDRQFSEAIAVLNKVFEQEKALYGGSEDSKVTDTYKLLGSAYLYNCQFEDALVCYEKYYRILRKKHGDKKKTQDIKGLIAELHAKVREQGRAVPAQQPETTGSALRDVLAGALAAKQKQQQQVESAVERPVSPQGSARNPLSTRHSPPAPAAAPAGASDCGIVHEPERVGPMSSYYSDGMPEDTALGASPGASRRGSSPHSDKMSTPGHASPSAGHASSARASTVSATTESAQPIVGGGSAQLSNRSASVVGTSPHGSGTPMTGRSSTAASGDAPSLHSAHVDGAAGDVQTGVDLEEETHAAAQSMPGNIPAALGRSPHHSSRASSGTASLSASVPADDTDPYDIPPQEAVAGSQHPGPEPSPQPTVAVGGSKMSLQDALSLCM